MPSQHYSNFFIAQHFIENGKTRWSELLKPLTGGHHYTNTVAYSIPGKKLGLKDPFKTLQKNSDSYFIFTWLIFYSYLCLQLWKYNPSIFLMTMSKARHKMEILLHYHLYLYLCIFFVCVHFPLHVYCLFSPSVVYSATASIPNIYFGFSVTLF